MTEVLNHTPLEALERKPVAIVAMGASQSHYLGVERSLRDVLAMLTGALSVSKEASPPTLQPLAARRP
jgi:NAD(P)H-dependent FMN reductase